MIRAGEDMFEAQAGIGLQHLDLLGPGGNLELGIAGPEYCAHHASVTQGDANQNVDPGGLQAANGDAPPHPALTVGAFNEPAQGDALFILVRDRVGDGRTGLGKQGTDISPAWSQARGLPGDLGSALALGFNLEECGGQGVGVGGGGQGEPHQDRGQ